jgi:hypothetical protein
MNTRGASVVCLFFRAGCGVNVFSHSRALLRGTVHPQSTQFQQSQPEFRSTQFALLFEFQGGGSNV